MDAELVENECRRVVRAEYKGFEVRVITGYDIRSNRYPVHLEVTQLVPVGTKNEVLQVAVASSADEGIKLGLAAAKRMLDREEFERLL